MKILFICNEYPPYPAGGIGIFTKELSESLSIDNEIYVLGLYNIEKEIKEKINNVNVIRVPRKTKKAIGPILDRIRLYYYLKDLIKKESIDIVECQDFNGLFAFFPSLSAKIVVRLHGSVSYFYNELKNKCWKYYIWKIIERNHLKKADYIVSVSDYTLNQTYNLFGLDNINSSTIYNGVRIYSPYKESPLPEFKKYIFAGSIIKKKGIVELVDAWNIFSKGKKNVSLDIYGKDIEGLKNELTMRLENDSCKFFDPIGKDQLLEKINESDFFIAPTKAEAFSLAPLEAMASSTLLLYTDQTSAKELVTHNYNGILISGTTSNDILESLEYSYLLNNTEYNRMTKTAYSDVTNKFNVDLKCRENNKMYINILHE